MTRPTGKIKRVAIVTKKAVHILIVQTRKITMSREMETGVVGPISTQKKISKNP